VRHLFPLALVVATAVASASHGQEPVAMKIPAPELEGITDWVNTKAVKLGDLKGKVVVFHFWTFG
jgi:hypothetical protein